MSKLDDFIILSNNNPAELYLSNLDPNSRSAQRHALNTISRIVGYESYHEMPWHQMRYAHTAMIRASLLEKYAPATVNRSLAALKGALKCAWRLGLMSADEYMRATDLKRVRHHGVLSGRQLSRNEIATFVASCEDGTLLGIRDKALFAILRLGLRRLEISLLDFEHLQQEKLLVHGKGRKVRLVPLVGTICKAVMPWLTARGEHSGSFFHPVNKNNTLVRRRLSPNGIYGVVNRRADKADIDHFTPHDLRRTFASELLAEGVDISIIQKLMGHASASQTARYDRRDDKAKKEAILRLTL